ncbi:hypothetical protein CQW23_10261 [Capsicum baccatum]|uniref:PPM-type phosphatase domain-containing protein n=1 Tax=Capsicum baccatum TaxID=33114 RepID=A0A2G2WZ39_CAPBA|nr:hypothetical protein CQW23_10261 [Capsicum baccatum]
MYRAFEVTELTYLDMTDRVLDRYPEVALMGSFLLAALMRDEDVYVMNVGDSRAIVEKYEPEEVSSSSESKGPCDDELTVEGIVDCWQNMSLKMCWLVTYARCLTYGEGVPYVDFDPNLFRTRYASLLWNYGLSKEDKA